MVETGTVIVDRYRLLEQLARGGMGTVWRAEDERLQRPVAIKVLHAQHGLHGADAELAAERAMREARITARLHHPNAVPVFDVVEHEGRPCLVMQYLPSRSLQVVLDDVGAMPADRVARIGAELAGALAAAHRAGIIHRDVKPANVLITDDGTAKLTDFGISHALGDASLTSTGMVTGTPAYLAPEVARGAAAGFASDVYSLGSTLYRAVEGTPPFGGDANAMAVLHRVASGRFTPPSPDGPLTPLLEQMLHTTPAQRPPMHNVALALRELATGGRPRVTVAPGALPPTTLTPSAPTPATTRAVAWPTAAVTSPPTTAPSPSPSRSTTSPAGPPAVLPPSAPAAPAAPSDRPRRRRGAWIAATVVGLLVVGGAVAVGIGYQSGDDGSAGVAGGAASSGATSPVASAPAPDTGSTDGSGSPTGTPTPTDTPTPTGAPTATELTDALTSYYDLMPGDTDAGWERLTASYQVDPSGGRSGYDEFWGGISEVTATDIVATPPDTVVATLAYVFTNGSTSTERTSFGFVREDGVLKIDSSQVVGSGG